MNCQEENLSAPTDHANLDTTEGKSPTTEFADVGVCGAEASCWKADSLISTILTA